MAFYVYDPGRGDGPVRVLGVRADHVFDPERGSGTVRDSFAPKDVVLTVPADVSVEEFFNTDESQRHVDEVLERSEPIAVELPDTQALEQEDKEALEGLALKHHRIVVVSLPDADS